MEPPVEPVGEAHEHGMEKESANYVCLEICAICCEPTEQLINMEAWAGKWHSACNHEACAPCIEAWVGTQLEACAANYMLRIQCIGCQKMMPQKVVLACSSAARCLADNLERREKLKQNKLFPEPMQVNCKVNGCVGIGYLGYEHVMCMICEEQWLAAEETVADSEGFGDCIGYVDRNGKAIQIKPCPKCGILIDKNGGCDHMHCSQCKHDYWWSTGKAYR